MKIKKSIIVIILVLTSIPTIYRIQWNRDSVFIGSDPQVKYYQAYQLSLNGFHEKSIQCNYPAHEFDPEFKYFPMGYPWAFIINNKCFYQYPIIFSLVQWILGGFITTKLLTFIPIFFYGCNIYLTYLFLNKNNVPYFINLFFTTILHLVSPIFLSTLDYSELSLTNFTLLIFLNLFYIKEKNNYAQLTLGFVIIINFFLRPESTLLLLLFLMINFIFSLDKISFIKNNIIFILSAIAFFILISSGNFLYYGHFLGMRGMNTINDLQSGSENNFLYNWVSDLWGNEFKIGIFKGYPILFLFVLGVVNFCKREDSNYIFLSGFIMILILPILSPYRAGVDIFGMRYYESSIYMLSIGFFLITKDMHNLRKGILFISILSLSYFGYKSDLRAIKLWSSAANSYHIYENKINSINPDIIIHRGLSQSYMMGNSFLLFPQISIYSQKDYDEIIEVL